MKGLKDVQARQSHHERQDWYHDGQCHHDIRSSAFSSPVLFITRQSRQEQLDHLVVSGGFESGGLDALYKPVMDLFKLGI
jgi:hypothetical protein